MKAIERARVEQNREPTPSPPQPPMRINRVKPAPEPNTVLHYQEASFTVPYDIRQSTELRDAPRNELAGWVTQVVEVEGPVHMQEIARRLSLVWGYASTGPAIKAAVADAAEWALQENLIRYSDSSSKEFLDRMDAPDTSPIRDRSNASAQVRQLRMLPPTEVQAAIIKGVEQNIAIDARNCAVQVARMLGYGRASKGFQALVQSQIQTLVRKGRLQKVKQ